MIEMGVILEHKHIIVRAEVASPAKTVEELEAWIMGLIKTVNMQIASIPQSNDGGVWVASYPNKISNAWLNVLNKVSKIVKSVNELFGIKKNVKNPISWDCKIPGNVGKTCVAIIETSNVAYHDWETEYGALIQLDLYSCGPFTIDQVVGELQKFNPLKIEYTFIDREHALTLIESKTNSDK